MALCAAASVAKALYVVDFEGAGETKTAYASGTVALSGLDWDLTEALIGTADNDFKYGNRSARLKGYDTSSMTMLADKADGLGTLSFQYRRYGTDAQVDWKVEVSSNGGVSWAQVGSAFTAPATDDVQTFSEAVNLEGAVRIRIKRAAETGTSDRRLNIDDITLTNYPPDGNNPPVVMVAPQSVAVFAGQPVSVAVSASDADGDEVTLSVSSLDIADVATFFDPLTGAFEWTPTTAGVFVTTFTADDGEDQDAKDLTITVGLAAPQDLAADPVGATTATASWSPVTGATGYRVDVHALHGAVAEVLAESFAGFTGPEYPGAATADVSGALDTHTQTPGWSGALVYQSAGMAKLGTGSGIGWLQTPPMDLSGDGGTFTITVDAGAWPTDTSNRSIDVLLDGVALQTLELSNSAIERHTIVGTGGMAASVVRFTAQIANANRFFLDNLTVGTGETEHEEVWADQPVATASVALSDLAPGLTYRVVVRATDGTVTSEDSAPLLFETGSHGEPPADPVTPRVQSVVISETEIEVGFSVAGGLEDGAGVAYALWSAPSLEGEPGWLDLEAAFTPQAADAAVLTAVRPPGETAFFVVRTSRQ